MKKSALIILLLLACYILPGQINVSFPDYHHQKTDNYLTFSRLNLDKYLGSNHAPCTRNYFNWERQNGCKNVTASHFLSAGKDGAKKSLSAGGVTVEILRQGSPEKLYCILSIEALNPSGTPTGNTTGRTGEPNHFVSYYPGLLNEKIL
jgi:hypothetical protein